MPEEDISQVDCDNNPEDEEDNEYIIDKDDDEDDDEDNDNKELKKTVRTIRAAGIWSDTNELPF